MKKRKIKLFASIASLAMVVAVMAVGVWATTAQTATIQTKVAFTAAQEVEAYVFVEDTNQEAAKTEKLYAQFTKGHPDTDVSVTTTNYTEQTVTSDAVTLNLGSNALVEAGTHDKAIYTYKITITNVQKSTADKPVLTVTLPAMPTCTGLTMSAAFGGDFASTDIDPIATATSWSTGNVLTLEAGKTGTITMTVTYNDVEKSLAETADIGFALTLNVAEDASLGN